jgi:hypothetical protein
VNGANITAPRHLKYGYGEGSHKGPRFQADARPDYDDDYGRTVYTYYRVTSLHRSQILRDL